MEETSRQKLFFIISPDDNLKTIETFLSKRDFIVYTATELQDAVVKAIELSPDFIFIAWDHKNPKIANLPKLFNKTVSGHIIPFVMSNSREANRKLNFCEINPKLYPPASGPAIERLILKIIKSEEEEKKQLQQKAALLTNKLNTDIEIQKIKSQLLQQLENQNNTPDFPPAVTDEKQLKLEQEKIEERSAEQINKVNNFLQHVKSGKLNQEQIECLQSSLKDKLQSPLEKLIESLAPNANTDSNLIFQQGIGLGSSLGNQTESGQNSTNLGMQIEKNVATGQDLSKFSYNPQATDADEIPSTLLRTFCTSIFSAEWCGYLLITTEAPLDFSSIDLVFSVWYKEHFKEAIDAEETDFFEFRIIDKPTLDIVNKKADYTEIFTANNYEVNVNFFHVSPENMSIQLSNDSKYIKCDLIKIPVDTILNFSIHLYLNENQKYILYTQATKGLTTEQKNRLIQNRVVDVYTSLQYEKEFKRFKAEYKIREIISVLEKNEIQHTQGET